MVRTRFAPSPTGLLHVGGMRTAIFDYLFARANNGQFIVRIEDTDRERFIPEGIKYIEECLQWMQIERDNEIFFHQSERLEIYSKYSDRLISENKAYKCFCSKERLDTLREEQVKLKKPPGYDGLCRNLNTEEIREKEQKNNKYVIRFKMPKETREIKWNDLIRGEISIRSDIQEDPVIIKSDGFPTYHLANVVDDHEMKITTVIRGEEWIPSTPKHILLYEALGLELPKFAHTPLITGKNGKKLSKRHGDTAFLDYRDKGYLPEAMLNFLALLGWNDGTTQELYTKEELIKKFDIKGVGKSPAIFDIERLNWINGEKIRALTPQKLTESLRDFDPEYAKDKDTEIFIRAVKVMQTRMVTLKDFTAESLYFFEKPKIPHL
ncbi:glutamate--tRNA ligase [Patescibacteria group bacterium]|nr:glutamate--tRNA ligase [Patescibacteria group bacterium]